jgi:hypothetical protein
VPETRYVLHYVEDEQKEDSLFHHSEKLAIAFVLMRLPPQIPIQIVKNFCVWRIEIAIIPSSSFQRLLCEK